VTRHETGQRTPLGRTHATDRTAARASSPGTKVQVHQCPMEPRLVTT